ncbi:MAG: ATP-binding protein [Bifidobacterium bifidum]
MTDQPEDARRLGARAAENLDFVAGCEDLALRPVGTGKSHLAIAIGRLVASGRPCALLHRDRLPALRRAQQENRSTGNSRASARPDSHHRRVRLPAHRRGGSRLLFQIISDSYETRSIIYTTNIDQWMGTRARDKNMAAALIDRTVHHGRLIRFEGRSTEANTPHDQITNTTQTGSGRYRTPCGKPLPTPWKTPLTKRTPTC